MTAPDPRLGEIEARLAARTEGPWVTDRYFWKTRSEALGADHYWWAVNTEHPDCAGEIARLDDSDPEYGNAQADAALIAHAPTDLAYLLAELRTAREALARVEGVADKWWANFPSKARDLRAAVAAADGDGRG